MTIGGGFKAIYSVARYARKIGPLKLYQAVSSKNACKACAFGTGGQNGGVFNERNKGIEICNKNIQAHLSDIRPTIPNTYFLENDIAQLATLSGYQLEALGRIGTPLYKKRGDAHFTPLGLHEAIGILAERLKSCTPDRSFFYASGRSSNEAAFLLQLLARVYGTNNVNNCSYYCHQASGVGLTNSVGVSTATVQYADLEKADCIFVIGANPASNHPRYLKCLIECRRRGGQVIVINPAKEPGMVRFASPSDWKSMLKGGEDIASHYTQVSAGGDLACLQGIAKAVLELKQSDSTFIDECTEGFADYQRELTSLAWQDIENASGISKDELFDLAKLYSQSTNTIFSWSMGLTHHLHGVANIEALASLALLRGMVGKPGAGLLPLRGHSNIQGTGSMGFTPTLKQAIAEKLESKLGDTLPTTPGLDTMACMRAAQQGDMSVAVCLGGNLFAANPDTRWTETALNNIPFKCFINTTLNLSHTHGVDDEVLILPSRARDEETQATTQESMFNYVRLSSGGIDRHPQLVSEIDLICELGKQLIPTDKLDFSVFQDRNRVREWIGDTIPGFKKIQNIEPSKQEFQIGSRTLHTAEFPTASKKAAFRFHALPENTKVRSQDFPFTLTTVRSEGQFNSIIYHEYDTYRGQSERNVLMIHPDDMANLSLKENDRVTLTSASGELSDLLVKPFDVKQGTVMSYYPEANVLIPKETGQHSHTPAFKSIPVAIHSA